VGNRLEGGARARVAIRKLSSEIIDFEPAEGRTPCRPPLKPAGSSAGSNRGGRLVAGGRYELYSNYALKIQAVVASIPAAG
jgi:hypothetical protein